MKAAGPRKLSQIYIQSLLFTKCRISPVRERESIGDSNFFLTLTTELLGYTFWKKCVNNFRYYARMYIYLLPILYYIFFIWKMFQGGKVLGCYLFFFYYYFDCQQIVYRLTRQRVWPNISGTTSAETAAASHWSHILLSNRTLIDIFAEHKPSERISFSV